MTGLAGALLALFVLFILLAGLAFWRGMSSDVKIPLRGLGLPRGSVRSLLAFLVIGSFIIFVFFGKDQLSTGPPEDPDTSLFETVLASMLTLVGSVTGFYFGARTGQSPTSLADPPDGEAPPHDQM